MLTKDTVANQLHFEIQTYFLSKPCPLQSVLTTENITRDIEKHKYKMSLNTYKPGMHMFKCRNFCKTHFLIF